ncbi:MAG: RIO1 family regulatory kinase/ATPase domain-containing protein, partial [Candidatus Kariarchaeaceae archaeon]|jgi:serine/threonine-protein kinase RIO1
MDPVKVLDDLLDELDIMFNDAMMVHGDFSEHNIVWHVKQEKGWIIDVYQSQRYHPRYDTVARIKKNRALRVLKKDIAALVNYFQRTYRISYDIEEVFNIMIDDPVEDWAPDTLMSENFDYSAYIKQQKRIDYGH